MHNGKEEKRNTPPRGGHGPMRTIEKPKNFGEALSKLFKSLNDFKALIIVSLVLAGLSAILALVSPDRLSDLTDEITAGITPNINEEVIKDIMGNDKISMEDKMEFSTILKDINPNDISNVMASIDKIPDSISKIVKPSIDIDKVKNMALLLAILYVVSAVFSYIEGYSMTTISNNYAKDLRGKISSKINKLPLKYFDTHETGDVLSRITNDVDTVASNMNNSLATLVSSITLFVGSIIMMFATNYIMAITAIVSSLIGFAFMGLLLGKSQKYFIKRQQELGDLNGFGHLLVQIFYIYDNKFYSIVDGYDAYSVCIKKRIRKRFIKRIIRFLNKYL